jgi:hypothetical protein
VEEEKPRLATYLPSQAEPPTDLEPRYSDRSFSWPIAILAAVAIGVGAYLKYGREFEDIGFKTALAIATVVVFVLVAPGKFILPRKRDPSRRPRRPGEDENAG